MSELKTKPIESINPFIDQNFVKSELITRPSVIVDNSVKEDLEQEDPPKDVAIAQLNISEQSNLN